MQISEFYCLIIKPSPRYYNKYLSAKNIQSDLVAFPYKSRDFI